MDLEGGASPNLCRTKAVGIPATGCPQGCTPACNARHASARNERRMAGIAQVREAFGIVP